MTEEQAAELLAQLAWGFGERVQFVVGMDPDGRHYVIASPKFEDGDCLVIRSRRDMAVVAALTRMARKELAPTASERGERP